MTIGQLVRARRDRSGPCSVRRTVSTDEVRCGSNRKLWRFSRMLCALQLTPAHGVEKLFIAQVVRECNRELWRLSRIHASTTVRCHKNTSKQKQQQ